MVLGDTMHHESMGVQCGRNTATWLDRYEKYHNVVRFD
jgi:hypothetical protein